MCLDATQWLWIARAAGANLGKQESFEHTGHQAKCDMGERQTLGWEDISQYWVTFEKPRLQISSLVRQFVVVVFIFLFNLSSITWIWGHHKDNTWLDMRVTSRKRERLCACLGSSLVPVIVSIGCLRDIPGEREPQLRHCLCLIGLWTYLWGNFPDC